MMANLACWIGGAFAVQNRVKRNEAGLECDLCPYWFHTKCEGVGAGRSVQGSAKV